MWSGRRCAWAIASSRPGSPTARATSWSPGRGTPPACCWTRVTRSRPPRVACRTSRASDPGPVTVPTVRTPTLEIGYEEWGDAAGAPVVLLHGFPDDAHAWSGVAPPLAAQGCRVFAPYLRGYGPTRFLDATAPRMAQQAAIGQDLLDFLDALGIGRAALGGYDWGGRAACITAILAPARVRALLTIG